MVDTFHFNSQNTKEIFEKYIEIPRESCVIPITHRGVLDHRKERLFDSNILHLGFIGSEAPYKGFPMLKNVITKLNSEGYKNQIHLDVYGGKIGIDQHITNIEFRGRFCSTQMEDVYDSMDLLVVPSIWYETFSLITIEALQFGLPVLVSNKVGAKDIVKQIKPDFVFEGEDSLYTILRKLIISKDNLVRYNKNLLEIKWQWSLELHAKEIVNKLYR